MTIKVTISVTDGSVGDKVRVRQYEETANADSLAVLESGQCMSTYIWSGKSLIIEEVKDGSKA